MYQGFGNHEAAFEAPGQFDHDLVQVRFETEAINQVLPPFRIVAHTVIAGVEAQRLVNGEEIVNHDFLVHDPDHAPGDAIIPAVVMAEDFDRAGADVGYPANHVDRGALARTIRAKQAEIFRPGQC